MVGEMSVVALAAFALASPAVGIPVGGALDTNQYSISISGFVPVVCRATMETTMVVPTSGEVRLGALNEFCNNAGGYDVYADYSPSLAQGALIVDGHAVNLSRSGTTRITQTNRAGIAVRDLSLSLPKGATGGSVSFRIVPR